MDHINLDGYTKTLFINCDSENELLEQIQSYEECSSGGAEKIRIKIKYFKLQDNWFYLDFKYDENYAEWSFWHYQNLFIWLAESRASSFCFAYKKINSYEDSFYSRFNDEDEFGSSVVGIFKGAEFLYELPAFYIDWWTGEGCSTIGERYIFGKEIDTSLLQGIEDKAMKEIELVVSD